MPGWRERQLGTATSSERLARMDEAEEHVHGRREGVRHSVVVRNSHEEKPLGCQQDVCECQAVCLHVATRESVCLVSMATNNLEITG